MGFWVRVSRVSVCFCAKNWLAINKWRARPTNQQTTNLYRLHYNQAPFQQHQPLHRKGANIAAFLTFMYADSKKQQSKEYTHTNKTTPMLHTHATHQLICHTFAPPPRTFLGPDDFVDAAIGAEHSEDLGSGSSMRCA